MDAAQQGPRGTRGRRVSSILGEALVSPPCLPHVQILWLQESIQGSTRHRAASPEGLWTLILKNCP